jgi:hypothetical protein
MLTWVSLCSIKEFSIFGHHGKSRSWFVQQNIPSRNFTTWHDIFTDVQFNTRNRWWLYSSERACSNARAILVLSDKIVGGKSLQGRGTVSYAQISNRLQCFRNSERIPASPILFRALETSSKYTCGLLVYSCKKPIPKQKKVANINFAKPSAMACESAIAD